MSGSGTQRDTQERPEVARGGPLNNVTGLDDLLLGVENQLEFWRQIMHFIGLARGKKFETTDEDQFLELKGKIVQELELILASGECSSPPKDDVHQMMNSITSLRNLSQLSDGALAHVEHEWHLIYITWHATLGQLKARHKALDSLHQKSGFLRRRRPR